MALVLDDTLNMHQSAEHLLGTIIQLYSSNIQRRDNYRKNQFAVFDYPGLGVKQNKIECNFSK